jgi:hypothetical protein
MAMSACLAAAPLSAHEKPAVELTEEEKKEQEIRKACKLKLCDIVLNRRADGPDVTCHVVKTWHKERLDEVMQKGKLSWPWGLARCNSDIRIERAMLLSSLAGPRHEAEIGKHHARCEVEREGGKERLQLTFEVSPKVTFENGRATKAKLNWGSVQGSATAKGALATASVIDNSFNVLQGTLIEEINDLLGPKCAEVKAEVAK